MKLAEILQCDPEWIVGPRIENEPELPQSRRDARLENLARATVDGPTRRPKAAMEGLSQIAASGSRGGAASNSIPVFSVAWAADGVRKSINLVIPIEMINAPAPLTGVNDAFGLYIIGEEMRPVFRPGDLVFIHPGKPSQVGDDVVAIAKDGTVDIGTLTASTPEQITIEQYNPVETMVLRRSDIDKLYLIVGNFRR